jgi:hypothetical protein
VSVDRDRTRAAYVASLPIDVRRQLDRQLTTLIRQQQRDIGAEVARNGHSGARLRVTEWELLRQALRDTRPIADVGNGVGRALDLVTTVGESTEWGRSPRTLTSWAESGEVPARKAGGVWLLSKPDLEQRTKDTR